MPKLENREWRKDRLSQQMALGKPNSHMQKKNKIKFKKIQQQRQTGGRQGVRRKRGGRQER